MQQHAREWLAFRDWQDGEFQGRIARRRATGPPVHDVLVVLERRLLGGLPREDRRGICRPAGEFRGGSKFPARPDDFAADFRKRTGLRRAVGQRFVFFADTVKHGWKATVLSDDGFVHPASWKTQVLRVVAALQGGIDLQSSHEFAGGIRYYLGEATRVLSAFEPLFWDGERADALATCDRLSYPDVLVLRLGGQRLVLLFNETDAAQSVVLTNKELRPVRPRPCSAPRPERTRRPRCL